MFVFSSTFQTTEDLLIYTFVASKVTLSEIRSLLLSFFYYIVLNLDILSPPTFFHKTEAAT